MSYYRLFQFGTANHFVSFKLLHPVRSNISIKWEEDIVVNYNLVDGDNKTERYTQTYALLLVPPEMILPDQYLETARFLFEGPKANRDPLELWRGVDHLY